MTTNQRKPGPLTDDDIYRHVDNAPNEITCPYCGDPKLVRPVSSFVKNVITVRCYCNACCKEWIDVYKLVGVAETYNRLPRYPAATVEVLGGVAEVVDNPAGVNITISDMDDY